MPQQVRPEGADANPRAGDQLEILRDAPVVTEAALRISSFHPVQPIAGTKKSVFVEGLRSEIVSSPIAGRNARACNPHLHCAVDWHEFQLAAGRRQADAA